MPWYLPVRLPILWDELRRRARNGRAQAVVLGYAGVLVAVMLVASLLFDVNGATVTAGQIRYVDWSKLGHLLWQCFLLGQLVVVVLISPALTATAVSAERERGSLELLLLTPMGVWALVAGKYLGAVGQLLVVIASGAPVVAVTFIYGGVTPADLLGGYLLLGATGLLVSAIGFVASSVCARTTPAIAWAYGFTLAMLLLPPLALVLLSLSDVFTIGDSAWFVIGNPFIVFVLREHSADLGLAIGSMLGEAAALLVVAIALIRRRHDRLPLFRRKVALETARQRSRLHATD
jgi:ABC-type transport system involved in multi-copper enzyme maturation permease subunit